MLQKKYIPKLALRQEVCQSGDFFGRKKHYRQFVDYHKYLSSTEWKIKKQHWIKLFGNKCICGCAGINLHHRHYKNLGTEPPHQLILLCNRCHYLIHGEENFTTDRHTMKLNLRRLIRIYRTPIKVATSLGDRNTSGIKKKGEAGTHKAHPTDMLV